MEDSSVSLVLIVASVAIALIVISYAFSIQGSINSAYLSQAGPSTLQYRSGEGGYCITLWVKDTGGVTHIQGTYLDGVYYPFSSQVTIEPGVREVSGFFKSSPLPLTQGDSYIVDILGENGQEFPVSVYVLPQS